jgi:hypothetical protein
MIIGQTRAGTLIALLGEHEKYNTQNSQSSSHQSQPFSVSPARRHDLRPWDLCPVRTFMGAGDSDCASVG